MYIVSNDVLDLKTVKFDYLSQLLGEKKQFLQVCSIKCLHL